MILFASPEFESVAPALRERVPQLRPGQYEPGRFDNGELMIDVETPVKGEPMSLSQSLRRITGLLPYLAYSRQDKNKPKHSLAPAWAAL